MTLSESPPGRPPYRERWSLRSTRSGVPSLAQTTFPTCRAHYPGGPNRCACRFLPGSYSLPLDTGGSASTSLLSRPAQASRVLRPAGLLGHLTWPLSQGSSSVRYRAKPLVSYQTYRLLSGWDFHPLVICAVEAHCLVKIRISALQVDVVVHNAGHMVFGLTEAFTPEQLAGRARAYSYRKATIGSTFIAARAGR
jgi:hypothetical protein